MKTEDGKDSFIARWSRRKLNTRADAPTAAVEKSRLVDPVHEEPVPDTSGTAGAAAVTNVSKTTPQGDLPTVESLTPDSDFTPFMQPEVDARVRNQALKTLFRDPGFNVMDRLDTYIDDYSKSDPIPEEMLRQLNQAKALFLFDDEKHKATPAPAETAAEPAVTAVAGQPLADRNDLAATRDIKQSPDSEVVGYSKTN